MNAVLFVDIDGVFHAVDSRDFEYRGDDLVVSDDQDLFQWAPLLWEVIKRHPVDLVVHSSWRRLYPKEELIARFPAEMQPRVVGVTDRRPGASSEHPELHLHEQRSALCRAG